jgi:hypothetical protein
MPDSDPLDLTGLDKKQRYRVPSVSPWAHLRRVIDRLSALISGMASILRPEAGGACSRRRGLDQPYTEFMTESRVVADHRIMGRVPCIRGTRIPVSTVVGLLADGNSVEVILAD